MEAVLVFLLILCVAVSLIFLMRYRRLVREARDQALSHKREASSWQGTWRAAESMLGHVLSHAAGAIIVTDAGRRIVHYNSSAEQLFGVPADRALGKPFIEVTMDSELDRLLRSSLSSRSTRTGTVRLTPSHKVLEATSVSLHENPETPYALMAMRDVTELRRLDTARREFVANISHELRAPLAAVKAMVETLQDGALSDANVAGRFLSQINAEVDNLTQLVRELLELSRIESGQTELRLAPSNVNEMVHRAVDRLQPQADQQGLQVTVEALPDDPTVVLDEDRVEQVVLNLLHNAIKFTPKGGQIRVRASEALDESSAILSISVQDTGVGIPEEDLPRIFERFYKVDKARKRGEGTGLGLAIAKHIVQAHGGRIWAESTEGKGSTFTFTLPIRQEVEGRP